MEGGASGKTAGETRSKDWWAWAWVGVREVVCEPAVQRAGNETVMCRRGSNMTVNKINKQLVGRSGDERTVVRETEKEVLASRA